MRGTLIAVLGCCALAAPAWGEAVNLTGKFPAGSPATASLGSLHVDRFDGRDGAQMAIALERALLQPDLGNPPHFRIRSDGADADGIVSGAVSTGVREEGFKRREKECVEKDAKKKCVREEMRDVRCRRRVVEMTAEVRVTDHRRGSVAWSGAPARSDETEWCRDDSPSNTAEGVVQNMLGSIVGELRGIFAPTTRVYSVRFRETTRGLPKDLAVRFKAAVKLSQRDLPAACEEWAAIDRAAPDNASAVFDLGLCSEARGDLAAAQATYARAATLLGSNRDADDDLNRIRNLLAAREMDAARGRR